MKKLLLSFSIIATGLLQPMQTSAAVDITSCKGWFESGYVTWTPVENAKTYNVYYKSANGESYTQLDNMLVRNYGTYGRADVLGITAGNYNFKVVPVDSTDVEMTADATVTETFTATAHDRGGFAHFGWTEGIGAYKDDGTLKSGAKVLYVHAGNAKTISTSVITSSKGTATTYTGLQAIFEGYEKGYDTTPLDVRIIGTINGEDMDSFGSSSEGLQIKGRNSYTPMNVTIEGVGDDATIKGFGILCRNCTSVELRNFAVMLCLDDCISLDTDNSHVWVHNIDFFYGKTGGASDQAKGDGSLDVKADSKYMTFSYNHFWDSGKCSLCGMKSETGPNWITYHHNWFDHSDSRHPRIRTMSVHAYNNYFDGNSKYGVGVTTGGNAFVENNYFRNCKYPMLISLQGSDIATDGEGTFSGETGGMIKAYGNYMTGQNAFVSHTTSATQFDAYVATSRDEQVPGTYKSLSGNSTYSNFDTDASLMYSGYHVDAAEDVPAIVSSNLGAGRMEQGDFAWTFDNSIEDKNYEVITALKTSLTNYKSSLVGFYGTTNSGSGSGEGGSGDSGSGEGGSGEGGSSTPAVTGDSIVCVFTGRTPSSTFFNITGNYSNSKGSAIVDGVTYADCLKLESSTNISFTTTQDAMLKLVFASTETVSIKIDGVKTTESSSLGANVYFAELAAGSHTLTKADSRNLFYIGIFYTGGATGIENIENEQNASANVYYNLNGQKVKDINRAGLYILNGKKIMVK